MICGQFSILNFPLSIFHPQEVTNYKKSSEN